MMRRPAFCLLALGAWLLAGCVVEKPARTMAWLHPSLAIGDPTAQDAIDLQTALIEASIGDRFVNHDLWTIADDQVLSLSQKAVLEENGFRIAQVGGVTPAGLLSLLTSERSCL